MLCQKCSGSFKRLFHSSPKAVSACCIGSDMSSRFILHWNKALSRCSQTNLAQCASPIQRCGIHLYSCFPPNLLISSGQKKKLCIYLSGNTMSLITKCKKKTEGHKSQQKPKKPSPWHGVVKSDHRSGRYVKALRSHKDLFCLIRLQHRGLNSGTLGTWSCVWSQAQSGLKHPVCG